MSVFDLSETLESINGGAARYDLQQVIPVSGAINNAIVGQGGASGLSQFLWEDQDLWWSPVNSYFHMKLQFTEAGTNGINQAVTYCDNFVMAMFSQIQSYVDSRPLDTVNTPWIIDTALTYSAAHNSFLKSWGSMTRIGEPLTTRLRNVNRSQSSSATGGTTDSGVLEVVFRPCISLFDVKLLPPGAQFKINFNFQSTALACFESLIGSITTGSSANQFNISIQSFSFYKASLQVGRDIALPARGVIDLCPAIANQYFLNGGATMKQNLTLPGTTNRILVVFQDQNSNTVTIATPVVDKITGVGTGYNPVTSFSHLFTTKNGADPTFSADTAILDNLWINLPEIAYSGPQPIYAFGKDGQDLERAYSDFCHITQGTKDQMEGSVPFGDWHWYRGISIIQPIVAATGTATGLAAGTNQLGDPNNPQQYWYFPVGVAGTAPTAADVNSYNQTARWGWSGRCPGPIFAFPVVRPEGKMITCGTLNFTTKALGTAGLNNVISVCATIIASYSMALVVEYEQSRNKYKYQLVEGI